MPNVSYCVNENEVHYNPYVEQPQPNNTIIYAATEKLAETTSNKNGGLHTNAFNTTIKSHTFENGVGTIEFNEDVTTVGAYAFYGSTHTSISMPDSVTSIGDRAFSSCSGLTSITIPSGVTSIDNDAFNYCRSLTSIDIPSSVTSIGDSAFQSCSVLKSIDIPSGVTRIGDSTFSGCSGLTSCTIGSGVTSIGRFAFSSCSGLTSITIPSSVTTIGSYAFQNCYSLKSITSNATTAPTIQSDTFYTVKTGGTLTVPRGSSGYNVWMGTGNYYLGLYGWNKVEQ